MKIIPIPKRLQKRPRYKGLPIPYIALIKENGDPDFRAIDQEKRMDVSLYRRCQLCADKLGRYFFFVGGPEAAKGNQYFEPPVHLDCLIYAMQVCPFILGKIEHAPVEKVQAANPDVLVTTDETFSPVNSRMWVIKKATGFRFGKLPSGILLLLPSGIQYETEILYPEKMDAGDWARVKQQLMKGKHDNDRNTTDGVRE